MKILFFTNMYPSETNIANGIFVKNLVDGLLKRNNSVEVLHLKVKNPIIDYLKGIFILRKKLNENNFDFIHAHYGFMGFICAFQRKVPYILTLHGSDVNIWWQRIFSRIGYLFAEKVIVTNQVHKKMMGNKAVLIPTGFDNSIFKPMDKIKSKQDLGLDINKKYILFPSSKLRKVKNYPLFKQIISELKLENNDYDELTLENLTPSQVNLYFNSAEVLVLTSFYEGSPIVIREALACNLPIVSVNVGDVELQIKDKQNCKITSFEPNEIKEAVKSILLNKSSKNENYQEVGNSINENIEETISLYNKINFLKK